MSLPQQQPPVFYPNSVPRQPPKSHSNGSFGTVFIVLGVIIVVSVIACVLGRLCNRRRRRDHHHHHQHHQKPKQNPAFGPKETDIEHGLGRGMIINKGPGNGGVKLNGQNGEIKGESKPSDSGAA